MGLCVDGKCVGSGTHVLSDHVETGIFEEVQVPFHRFDAGWRVESVRPESLIQRTEDEFEFTVEQRSCVAVDCALADSSEAGIALHGVAAELDFDAVQSW